MVSGRNAWTSPMTHIPKGFLAASPEWMKHLRGLKRAFWKRHREAEQREAAKRLAELGGSEPNLRAVAPRRPT
jgi:hypothetical protein